MSHCGARPGWVATCRSSAAARVCVCVCVFPHLGSRLCRLCVCGPLCCDGYVVTWHRLPNAALLARCDLASPARGPASDSMLVNQTVSAGNLRRGGAPPGCASAHTRPHRSHPRTWGEVCGAAGACGAGRAGSSWSEGRCSRWRRCCQSTARLSAGDVLRSEGCRGVKLGGVGV